MFKIGDVVICNKPYGPLNAIDPYTVYRVYEQSGDMYIDTMDKYGRGTGGHDINRFVFCEKSLEEIFQINKKRSARKEAV